MKRLLVVGDDKIGRLLLENIYRNSLDKNLDIVSDQSSNLKRIFSLILKKRISFIACIKMFLADLRRENVAVFKTALAIKNNNDLFRIIKEGNYTEVLLFRAGLIISKKNIGLGLPFKNVHCAKVPEYGGLGSIYRAISDQAYEQNATMHVVTSRIDEGEVLKITPYKMKKSYSYKENEDMAYFAGIELILDYLGRDNAK